MLSSLKACYVPIFCLDFLVLNEFLTLLSAFAMLQIQMRSGNMWQFKCIDRIGSRKNSRAKDQMHTSNEFSSLGFIQVVLFLLKYTVAGTGNYFALCMGISSRMRIDVILPAAEAVFAREGFPFQMTPSS